MKLAMCFFIISSCLFAQSNFTVFNNNGQTFYVILNGVKQNSLPQTNVVVSGLVNSAYSVKLIFSDGKTADIDKNFFIDSPCDITTRIIFKKGKGKLKLISQIKTQGTPTGETVINYRPDNNASFSDGSVGIGFIGNSTTTTGETETNMNQSGNGSVTIKVMPNTSNDTVINTTPNSVSQIAVNLGCKNTLTNSSVFIEDLKLQSFEDDRLDALKLALVNTCLYSADAEKIMDLFTFDANQLSAAKLLFDRLLDKDKASSLTKHITFDSTKMEFRNYISGKY